jgi:endonuclease YncB( thermonuclease family)
MLRRLVVFLLFAAFSAQFPAQAEAGDIGLPDGLRPGGTAKAVAVIDGDTLTLDDGREVRLVGLQAPKLPLGRRGFKAWPLADEAKAALERLALGRRLALHYGGREVDRHRRVLAHLTDAETGRWIQGAMLAQGMARVYTFKDNRSAIPEMLAIERNARAARRGIWSHPYYAVRTPETLTRDADSFQLVEGTVKDVAERKGKTFLNFGADWRSDFTVQIASRDAKSFRKAGLSLKELEGRRIRVRGWIKSFNGPLIEATHPEQIDTAGLDPAVR